MRSARVESSVMRIIFGLPAARREAGREIEIRKPRRINRAARNMKNSLNAWRPRSETDQLAGCGKSLNRDDSPPQGLKPSLILHDLRGAKASLYHSAAGFRDFFRSLLELATERSGGCCSLAQRSRSLPYCQPIFLRRRRYDPVHPQILHDLSIMIGYVPHRRDRNPQPRIRPGVRPLDTRQSVLRSDGRKHAVAIVE